MIVSILQNVIRKILKDVCFNFANTVSIHTAGRMHSVGESMHTARLGMTFYLLI